MYVCLKFKVCTFGLGNFIRIKFSTWLELNGTIAVHTHHLNYKTMRKVATHTLIQLQGRIASLFGMKYKLLFLFEKTYTHYIHMYCVACVTA